MSRRKHVADFTGDLRQVPLHALMDNRARLLGAAPEKLVRTHTTAQRGWAVTPRNEYPPNWKEIATSVKAAAGNCCIRCAHPHSVEGWFILTVHHMDGDKANGAWWNLLALCQRCHLNVQARVAPERPYLFNHTPWIVPYVCGFYAHYYGRMEISREEAMADPSRYLRMGQPWLFGNPL